MPALDKATTGKHVLKIPMSDQLHAEKNNHHVTMPNHKLTKIYLLININAYKIYYIPYKAK